MKQTIDSDRHPANALADPGVDNPSRGPHLNDLLRATRRNWFVRTGVLLAAAWGLGGCSTSQVKPAGAAPIGFKPVVPARDDAVRVPDGYSATVLFAWGDPIGDPRGMPTFRFDGGNGPIDQSQQAGTHHDGMYFFPLPATTMAGVAVRPPENAASDHGLLAINHEYPDYVTLFPDGADNWSELKVRKAQHALGVSVIEVRRVGPRWSVVRPSTLARRIHGNTPMRISGPAAGDAAMRTRHSPDGSRALGTFANCANGWTPWGTYLTCEENFHVYFRGRDKPTPAEARYGISARADGARWSEFDPRFDLRQEPNEPNHFGWVVEIDPYDPESMPVKRTAMGRKKQEGAAPAIAKDGRVAFYMGDDQAFEYLYKFVTAAAWNPADRAANRDLLDQGTLYVARFDAQGKGAWIELAHGRNGLDPANGFASQADVLIRARAAADHVGATRLDRPEWTAVDAAGTVYVALTNNGERGQPGKSGADAANPRAPNRFGHILRFTEAQGDAAASTFEWEVFLLAGDPRAEDTNARGNLRGDLFASPDGLMIDRRGVLWVQTDISPRALLRGDHAIYGNNQMLAIDPVSGESRRFLTGPRGCEITGACLTPDGTTMFVNIQHPGEVGERGSVTLSAMREQSNWPDHRPNGRPRSATVVIRKLNGDLIGT